MKQLQTLCLLTVSLSIFTACGNQQEADPASFDPIDLNQELQSFEERAPTPTISFLDYTSRTFSYDSRKDDWENHLTLEFMVKAPVGFNLGYSIESFYKTDSGREQVAKFLVADRSVIDVLEKWKFMLLPQHSVLSVVTEEEEKIKIRLQLTGEPSSEVDASGTEVHKDYPKVDIGYKFADHGGLRNLDIEIKAFTNAQISQSAVVVNGYAEEAPLCSLVADFDENTYKIVDHNGDVVKEVKYLEDTVAEFNELIRKQKCQVNPASIGRCEIVKDNSGSVTRYGINIGEKRYTRFVDKKSDAESGIELFKNARLCY